MSDSVGQKPVTGIPEGWVKVEGLTGYMSGATIREVFSNGRDIVICGDPGEEGDHNCDEMGCGWDHVLVRLSDTVPPDTDAVSPIGDKPAPDGRLEGNP